MDTIYSNFDSGMLTDITDISIYYHADCTDGLLAAGACYNWYTYKLDRLQLGSSYLNRIDGIPAQFVAYRYGMLPKRLGKGDLLILVDFAFDSHIIETLLEDGVRICIIDHHEPMVKSLNQFILDKKVWGILTTEYSGAVLAYAFFKMYSNMGVLSKDIEKHFMFYTGGSLPRILCHAQDRDLWRRTLEGTDQIMLGFYETVKTVEEAANIIKLDSENTIFTKLFDRGTASTEIRGAFLREALENKFAISFTGASGTEYTVQCVNLPESFRTEACTILFSDTNDIGASITILPQGKCKVSLRSKKGVVINHIALDMGGGGHPSACGFETDITNIRFLG